MDCTSLSSCSRARFWTAATAIGRVVQPGSSRHSRSTRATIRSPTSFRSTCGARHVDGRAVPMTVGKHDYGHLQRNDPVLRRTLRQGKMEMEMTEHRDGEVVIEHFQCECGHRWQREMYDGLVAIDCPTCQR